jgi:hypothetical protein
MRQSPGRWLADVKAAGRGHFLEPEIAYAIQQRFHHRQGDHQRTTLDTIAERLDRIEARSAGMKVVSNKTAPPFDNGAGSMIA